MQVSSFNQRLEDLLREQIPHPEFFRCAAEVLLAQLLDSDLNKRLEIDLYEFHKTELRPILDGPPEKMKSALRGWAKKVRRIIESGK